MLGEQFNSLIQEYRRRALFISSFIVIVTAGLSFIRYGRHFRPFILIKKILLS